MVTPLGREDADRVYVPETVPVALNFRVAVTFTVGATMSGCATFIVSVPEEEPVGVEVFEVVAEVVPPEVVVEEEETIGIVM
jgi:hypothetical protein